MSSDDRASFIDCAREAAMAAGHHALHSIDRRHEVAESFEHDIKLVLDSECQEIALKVIGERFPDHAILAEEDPSSTVADGYRWVVDPIDGTVNFSHGHAFWCTSVALQKDGQSIAACVFAPALDLCMTATSGGGAQCNGEVIHVSTISSLSTAMVHTGLDRNIHPSLPRLALFTRLADTCRKTRVIGSAALDLCYIAMGRADGYFEGGIYLWDVAAAGLIINEAGGRAEVLGPISETYRLCFIASNGHVHNELLELINRDTGFSTSKI